MKPKGAAVNFILTNKSKYAFKDVVIADIVPVGVGFRSVRPRPSIKSVMPNGSTLLEWRLDYMLPREKKTFYYTIDKKKLFMPKAKIVKYERVGEIEEIPLKRRTALLSAGPPAAKTKSAELGALALKLIERVFSVHVEITKIKKKGGR